MRLNFCLPRRNTKTDFVRTTAILQIGLKAALDRRQSGERLAERQLRVQNVRSKSNRLTSEDV